MAGAVDAGDLVLVLLGKGHQIVLGHAVQGRQRGVDKDVMGGGDQVQHGLQGVQIGEGLAAGEHEVALGSDLIHGADAVTDGFQAEAHGICVLLLVDAEGAVVPAVVGDEDGDSRAALAGLVRILGHSEMPTFRFLLLPIEW